MSRRFLPFLLVSCALTFSPAVAGQDEPEEAAEVFEARQTDLIDLAGYLGTLHRLHQLCAIGNRPDLFRDRMRELVPLEAPMDSTRNAMIAAFNDGYRQASADHLICSEEAEADYTETAEAAAAVTDRLYKPFR